jgi:diguanylate cyclase (GGDEF)-like protein
MDAALRFGERSLNVKYTGRIVLTTIISVLVVMARIYGQIYYNFPATKLPFIGIVAILICWWLGSQYDKVKFYSEKDILTELYNRRFVIQNFPKLLWQMSKRNKKLTLFLIDVDDFKKINDTHGHEMGDKVLQAISRILLANTTKKEIVARWAGDEFLILSPDSSGDMDHLIVTEMNEGLRMLSEEVRMDVSVSVGTSVYPDDAQTLENLLHMADREMYRMKSR